jgi:class 3 adenylate cyclase
VDWLLMATLLPLCLFGVVMSVVHGVRGDFVYPPFFLSSAPDAQSYPVARWVLSPSSAGAAPLVAGDRVLRLQGRDLRGASVAEFMVRWSEATRTARVLAMTIERGGERADVLVPLLPGYRIPWVPWWVPLPFILSLMGTALLLLLRAAHWHLARRFYVTSFLVALVAMPYLWAPTAPRAGIIIVVLAQPLVFGLAALIFFDFSPSLRLWGQRERALVFALCLLQSASLVATFWLPDAGLTAVLMRAGGLASIGIVIACLVALTRVYQRSDPLGRRQIKWVLYGLYVGTLPVAVHMTVYSLPVFARWEGTLLVVAMIALVAVPLGFLVAVAFYQFLDIDRLFSATLSYSILAILALAMVLGVMPTAARAASDAFGLDPTSSQLLLSLGIAAILVPMQRVARPRIDRLLFPERLTLRHGFHQLLAGIAECADIEELTRLVEEQLDTLLRPVSAILYGRAGDAFMPLAVRSRTAPPAFASRSPLIAALQERATPIAAERWTARRSASLTPFERAALETLDVAVLVPYRRGPDLVAFSCLGPKRSGDIYTPTDLALLGAVAGKISDRLLSIDASAVLAQTRAMQEKLRRYVPGAVAQRLVNGKDVEPGEREVTVLFVDIRGYTGFAEQRQATEIFQTVNRYTETVSALVQARRGVVVEFTGDGMMAVFGAPEEIPMKERAAVETARDILAAIAHLPEPTGDAGPALAVGVGIATGTAFVGNIQSADRLIWTVIGNTTNLAARLQSLTRELDAAVAIDETTFQRTGDTGADFVQRGALAIRGRIQRAMVYALPLPAHPDGDPKEDSR